MASKVNISPSIPTSFNLASFTGISEYVTSLVQTITNEFRDHALRLNNASQMDGTEIPTAPVLLKSYLKTALPSAVTYVNGMIMVSNDVGGSTPAFSDGTNWRRVADRNIIS